LHPRGPPLRVQRLAASRRRRHRALMELSTAMTSGVSGTQTSGRREERCPLPDRSVSLSAVAYAGSRLSSVHRGTARRDVMTVTQLLDADNMARWIQRDGVENILAGLSRYLESDLRRWQDFEKIPRLASHTD